MNYSNRVGTKRSCSSIKIPGSKRRLKYGIGTLHKISSEKVINVASDMILTVHGINDVVINAGEIRKDIIVKVLPNLKVILEGVTKRFVEKIMKEAIWLCTLVKSLFVSRLKRSNVLETRKGITLESDGSFRRKEPRGKT